MAGAKSIILRSAGAPQEDSATMLTDALLPTVDHKLATMTREDLQAEIQTMKVLLPATSMPISSPIQLHLIQMLSTIKHTWPYLTTRQPSMVHEQYLHGPTPTPLKWKSTEHY